MIITSFVRAICYVGSAENVKALLEAHTLEVFFKGTVPI